MIDRARTLFHAIVVPNHDLDFEPQLTPEPTSAAPGSADKLKVFQARLERGEELNHECDEKIAATLESQASMLLYAKEFSNRTLNARFGRRR